MAEHLEGTSTMGEATGPASAGGSDGLLRATTFEPPTPELTPHLSPVRVVVAIVLLVALVSGGSKVVSLALRPVAKKGDQWFAPYVDVTATPPYDFQDPDANSSTDVVLSFVVAKRGEGCTPTWGAEYTMDVAATALDLDRRLARLRERGGDAIVSFGGAANQELADACTDPQALADAYRSVVNRYHLSVLDLDLEGATLQDASAMKRRAKAIASVQRDRARAGQHLGVWLTLPMTAAGLQPEGGAAVDAMLAAGVDLSGVNVMAMEFGTSRPAGMSFADASLAGIDATSRQLVAAYRRAGKVVSRSQAYRMVGVTPMIGQNIYPSDRLDVDGARRLHAGAVHRGVKRFSMWSLNRDRPCTGNIDSTVENEVCSGVDQTKLEFSEIFGAGTSPASQSEQAAFANTSRVRNREQVPATDDARGPYDEWRPHREYEQGAKVVWRGRVFTAKWWNVGNQPDALVEHDWDSPWSIVGPVLATDPTPTTPPTVPPNTYRDWDADVTYYAGDKVERRGVGYIAKWGTRGEDPAADVDNAWQTPWKLITKDGHDKPGS
jgi:chitinase